jgi:hypothetical protein
MERERIIHSAITLDLVAPIRSDSPERLKEAEAVVFSDDLEERAAIFGRALKRLVSYELLPASMVVMEDFAHKYSIENANGFRREARIEHQYRLGAMLGLAAASLKHLDHTWNELPVDDVVSLSTVVPHDEIPIDAVRVDPIAASIIDQVAEHSTADLEDQSQAEHATRVGYFVARNLAALSMELVSSN